MRIGILTTLVIGVWGVATQAKLNIVVPQNAQMHLLNSQKKENLSSGPNEVPTLSEPTMIEMKGRIPILLLPVTIEEGDIAVNPPDISDIQFNFSQKQIDSDLSQVLFKIGSIQKSIAKGQIRKAEAAVTRLQNQFPNVAYLNFIKASVLYLKNDFSAAKEAIEAGLTAHPNNEKAKALLKKMEDK